MSLSLLHVDPCQVKLFHGEKSPLHSYAYFKNEEEERKCMDVVEGLVGARKGRIVGFEHDGDPVCCKADIVALAAQQGIILKEKSHPRTREDWMQQWGHRDFPTLDPELVQEILEDFLWKALESIEGERKDWVVDHDAWSRVLLDCIQTDGFPLFVKNREDSENLVVEFWDHKVLKWVPAGGARAMKDQAAQLLRDYLRRRAPHVNLGSLPGHAPFMNPIVEGVKAKLPTATDSEIGMLNGDTCRGLLRFDNGCVVDFASNQVVASEPRQRISFSTKIPWTPFEANCAARIKGFIDQFMEFVAGGGQSVRGTELETVLGELREAAPKGLYAVIWAIFEDADVAVWLIRQLCRGCAGLELLEEFLFFFDERGQNGKGTIMNLLRQALGDYYVTCPYKGALLDTASGGNCDRLAKCQGKRVVSCNEAFDASEEQHQFNPGVIKQLIGLDEPIETMAKYKSPLEWRGQALLVISSNTLPKFPAGDGGLSSRISLVRFPFTFVPKPKDVAEEDLPEHPEEPGTRWQDPSIKLQHMKNLIPEFFHWAREFNQALTKQDIGGRLMTPRPAKIEAETAELFNAGAMALRVEDTETTMVERLRNFEALHLTEVPENTNSQGGATPATCTQLESAFAEYLREKGLATGMEAVRGLLRRVYSMMVPEPPSKAFKVNKTSVRSFYRKTDAGTKKGTFKTALMLKGVIQDQLENAGALAENAE